MILKLIFSIIFILLFSVNSYSKPTVAIPFITLLDKSIDIKYLDSFSNLIKNELKKNTNISFIDLNSKFYSEEILKSDFLIPFSLENSIDFIIGGSITKFKFGIIFNLQIINPINSNIILSKQYSVNKFNFSDFIIEFNNDINKVIDENKYIIDLKEGNSEIRVNTIPKSSFIDLNGKFLSQTPVIIKGLRNDINKLEIYNEGDLLVKKISINSNDEKNFFIKINNKEYISNIFEIKDKTNDNYDLEIYSDLDNNKTKKNKESKFFKLDIITEPENLKVYLDDRLIGNTPVSINNLREGKHNLKIKKNKTIVFNEIVNSKEENKKFLKIHLYKLSKLYLETKPNNASISIDGVDFGLTPKYINIPFGYHKIFIRKSGFSSLEKDISIEYPNSLNLNLDLESLRNLDTSISFFPTAITNNSLNLNLFALSLGQLSNDNDDSQNTAYLYGSELNYGINKIFSNDYLSIGGQIGLFYNNARLFSNKEFSINYGIGGKVKIFEQNSNIPVSLAIGGFYRIDKPFNNYIVVTRDFDWSYFSLGTHFNFSGINGVNFNFSIKDFYKINIGVVSLIDFGLITKDNEYLAPIIGINIGYNFL